MPFLLETCVDTYGSEEGPAEATWQVYSPRTPISYFSVDEPVQITIGRQCQSGCFGLYFGQCRGHAEQIQGFQF